MAGPALVLCSFIIAGGLALASASASAGRSPAPARRARGQAVEAVLLRPKQVDDAALLDGLQLRSPQRTIAVPPWPSKPADHFELFAVATVALEDEALSITVVLSDGRAYYRTLPTSAEGAPRLAASTVANLLAAIEEDELPPDEEDVPLPPEQESEPESESEPKPKPKPKLKPEPKPKPEPQPRTPMELEAVLAGAAGVALGPPAPAGFAGGGGAAGLELRLPAAAVVSLAVRSHWHRVGRLTVGRARISLGGGYAWRRRRFELRGVIGLDVEPWGVRQGGERQPVAYPDGQERRRGLALGGHLRLVPAFRVPVGAGALRVGPRVELGGSALAQASGVARLVVTDADGQRSVAARVGGLELTAGLELGWSWALPSRR